MKDLRLTCGCRTRLFLDTPTNMPRSGVLCVSRTSTACAPTSTVPLANLIPGKLALTPGGVAKLIGRDAAIKGFVIETHINARRQAEQEARSYDTCDSTAWQEISKARLKGVPAVFVSQHHFAFSCYFERCRTLFCCELHVYQV